MTNQYEPPEVIEIGKAENVVLDSKRISFMVDNLGVALFDDGLTLDDFDE